MEKSMKNHSDKRALLVGEQKLSLFVTSPNPSLIFLIYDYPLKGIISFGGPSEGLKEAPDISTRVKGYLTWIQATSRNLVKPCWL